MAQTFSEKTEDNDCINNTTAVPRFANDKSRPKPRLSRPAAVTTAFVLLG
jgi:hypothetical protein